MPSNHCHRCRQALSAQLDNEATVADLTTVAAHLPSCTACQRFAEAALAQRRHLAALSVGPAEVAAPDFEPTPLAARIAASHAPAPTNGGLLAAFATARPLVVVLGVVGLTQIILGLANALVASSHDARHLSAWTGIFGLLLLVGALRPAAASILAPVAVAVPLVMVASASVSWSGGEPIEVGEAVHVLELVGGGLLFWLARNQDPSSSATTLARSSPATSA